MWHQLWSSSPVSTTMSASSAPGDRSDTVMMAIFAPAARAASSAVFVAAVPPSCEIPMTRPSAGGSSPSSNAWVAYGSNRAECPGGRMPAVRTASRRIAAAPYAACSEVPQPVRTTG